MNIQLFGKIFCLVLLMLMGNIPLLNAKDLASVFDEIEKMAYSKPDIAMKELSAIRGRLENKLDTFNFLSTKAFITYRQLHTELAVKNIQQLDSIVRQHNSNFRKHYLTLATIHSDREEYDDAIMCLLKAIDEDPAIRTNGTPYLNLAYYYGVINKPELEKRYMQTGYDLMIDTDKPSKKAYACNMMGMFMERHQEDDKAIQFYTQGKHFAYNAKRWDKYIDNALAVANIEFKRGNYKQVEFILYQVENYYSECLSPRAPAMGTLLFAKLCLEQGKLEMAAKYYDLTCRYSKNISYKAHLKDLFSFGIELFTLMGKQTLALEALQKYKQINTKSADNSLKNNFNINSTELNLTTFKENIELKKQKSILKIISVSIIFLLLLILILVRYRNKATAKAISQSSHSSQQTNDNLASRIVDLEDDNNKLHKIAEQQLEELHLIRFLFALPNDMRNFDLASLKEIAFSNERQISDNALELLRARISSQRQLNFETDHTKTYYANIELEKLNIPKKITDKYARFFNLCMNLANNNYKVSEKGHIASSKNELYYLCKTISGKSPAQLKGQLIQKNND